MHRKGYTQVPNHVWDDVRHDAVDIALLTWLSSHASDHIVKGPIARAHLGISEPTYNKRMGKLVEFGLLVKKKAHRQGKVTSIKVKASWPELSKEKMGSESDAEPTKSVRRNDGSLRRTIAKNSISTENSAQYGEVIDHQDYMQ